MPNVLTFSRLVLVPAFVGVAVWSEERGTVAGWSSPALWIVLGAAASDVLDGFIARRWELTTRIGALLDAVADKSFQFTTLMTLTLMGRPLFSQLPVWLLGSVFLRDLVLLSGWTLLKLLKRPVDFEHEIHGRIATVLVFGLVVGATLGVPESILTPLAGLAALGSLLSAAAYFRRGLQLALAHGPRSSEAG